MRYLFPLKFLSSFSRSNQLCTLAIFLLSIVLAIVSGYLKDIRPDPYIVINFVQPWTGFSWDIFVKTVKFIYTPVGLMFMSLVAFFLFLFLIYIFSGVKQTVKIRFFILPFIALSFLGIALRILSIILIFLSFTFPYLFVLFIVLYVLIFDCIILVSEFKVSLYRSIFAVIASFLLVFFISGFPGIAPYLAWI